MGFGLVFIGYASLLAFRVIPIELIGFFLIYLGAEKLQAHDKKFSAVKIASAAMFFESALGAVIWLSKVIKIPFGFLSSQTVENIENIFFHSGLVILLALLYRGVISISKAVGYNKGVVRAKFAFVSMIIFYAAQICLAVLPTLSAVLSLPVLIFQLLWMMINLILLYGCYAMIVTGEMLEKEEKKYNEYLEKHRPRGKTADPKIKKTATPVGTSSARFKATPGKKTNKQ